MYAKHPEKFKGKLEIVVHVKAHANGPILSIYFVSLYIEIVFIIIAHG